MVGVVSTYKIVENICRLPKSMIMSLVFGLSTCGLPSFNEWDPRRANKKFQFNLDQFDFYLMLLTIDDGALLVNIYAISGL